MTQDQIRRRRAEIAGRIADLKAACESNVAAERAKLAALRRLCLHPGGWSCDIGFDSGYRCDDCGYSE